MFDIIIIGGGPAGMTAGLYCGRAGMKTAIIEGNCMGGQITQAHRVENYPGIENISGSSFADNMMSQVTSFGVDIIFGNVKEIIKNDNEFIVKTDYEQYEGKAVIVATGAKARRLQIPGEKELIGKGVSYCAVCDGGFFRDKEVAVIGGGSTALGDAIYLSDICKRVYIVHRRNSFRGEEELVARVMSQENVELVLDSKPIEIKGQEKVSGLTILNTAEDKEKELSVDGVFVAIGHKPETDIFDKLLKLDKDGYVVAAEDCTGSTKGLFVAGDCRQKEVRQLTTAVADGTTAALGACEYVKKLKNKEEKHKDKKKAVSKDMVSEGCGSLKKEEKKESRVPLPKYTLGEELISAISHGLGAIFGIVALILCIVTAAKGGKPHGVISAVIYGVALIVLYTMSTIYHSLKPCKGKRVLRIFDHCSIFLLIAGTYTPFTLVSLSGGVGWTIFGIVWGVSILGIVFNAISVEKFKVFSMISYLVLGWVILAAFKSLVAAVPAGCIKLLVAGGITYTVGAIIFGIGSKVKYMHSLWHFFVLAGSILHFISIIIYVF